MISTKRIAMGACSLLMLGMIGYIGFWNFYLREYPNDVKPALRAVAMTHFFGSLRPVERRWEEEMADQARRVAALKESDRVAFYKGVLLITCDLDTSKGAMFHLIVGEDWKALKDELTRLRGGKQFQSLSPKQQQTVQHAISDLGKW